MEKQSRIKFNPVTQEIEVEGSEKFVKTYFHKLQGMLSDIAIKTAKRQKGKKAPSEKKIRKAKIEEPNKKRISNISLVLGFIKDNIVGISTETLKQKTGLSERQIWSIVNRAAREGKIKKLKRGLYGPT